MGPEAQPLRGWHWDSIQSALDAAEPGYTIVVRGVHRQSVAITSDGIALHGHRAALEPDATPLQDR